MTSALNRPWHCCDRRRPDCPSGYLPPEKMQPDPSAPSALHNFRKKPVVVEAHVFTESNGDWLAAWCGGEVREDQDAGPSEYWIVIYTLEGDVTARYGDWIIRGVKGEFYPCKPDIFVATYEPTSAIRTQG